MSLLLQLEEPQEEDIKPQDTLDEDVGDGTDGGIPLGIDHLQGAFIIAVIGFILACFSFIAEVCCQKALILVDVAKFQSGEKATINSMLDGGMDSFPTMDQVTMTLHLRLRHFTSHIPLLSYATEGSSEEFLVELVPKKKNMHVFCCNGLVSEAIRYEPKMFKWVHIGVGLNLTARTLYVENDDIITKINLKIDYSKMPAGNKLEVAGGGRFVLGQRLYSTSGGFHILESLDGEIADYKVYDTLLTPREIADILNCQNVIVSRPPIISLKNGSLERVGSVVLRQIYLDTVCSQYSTEFYLFFPEKRNFHDSKSWCEKIKGSLILPQNPELNEKLFHTFWPYREQCQDIWTHLYWLGFEGSLKTLTWQRLSDGRPLDWFNFLSQYKTVTKEFQCAAAVSHDAYKWAACPCEIEVCILCNFTTHPELRLRGLCKISLWDRTYSFRESANYSLLFDGLAHTMINFQGGTWVMRSRLYPDLGAKMVLKRRGEYPVGVHTWEIFGDRCPEKKTNILLTSCDSAQYTCNDGSCIKKDARCDLSVDCADESDEMNCNVIQLPPGYSAKIPPPSYLSEALPVYVSFNITSIKEFDLVSFTIGVDMLITTRWEDRRLKYKNLRASYRANQVEMVDSVWTPKLKYRDGTLSSAEFYVHSQAIYIKRLTGPLPDDDTTIFEDTLYGGIGNTLTMEQENSFRLKCYFHLQMYPFDRQICSIEFILHELTTDLGVLVKKGDGVVFTGQRRLLEYSLLSEIYSNFTRDSVSYVKVIMEFRNLFGYYIGNTFIPTLMLVLICYGCFWFDLTDFQDRIMVSLTALLVLATFFSQISQSIPRTSYLKLIDVWFLALITEVFAIIVSLVFIEVLRLRVPNGTMIKVVPLNSATSSRFDKLSSIRGYANPERLNRLFILVYPITLLILLFIFVSVTTNSLYGEIDYKLN
ncbi:uncharacterized protein [Palaemon carinicauda]|uniref:uncharacterized protein n=1 Tax=Palaemon carinicauda TaxID=392227 RepID=UPI0035B63CD8